jgi:hypothetical protein
MTRIDSDRRKQAPDRPGLLYWVGMGHEILIGGARGSVAELSACSFPCLPAAAASGPHWHGVHTASRRDDTVARRPLAAVPAAAFESRPAEPGPRRSGARPAGSSQPELSATVARIRNGKDPAWGPPDCPAARKTHMASARFAAAICLAPSHPRRRPGPPPRASPRCLRDGGD